MKKISRVVLGILMVVLSLSVTPKAAFAENKTVTVIEVGNVEKFKNAINTVNSASEGEYVISLTDDMEINGVSIQSQCPVTLLGNGHTLTVAQYASIHVAKGAQVKLGSEDGNVLEIRSVSETSNDVPGLLGIEGTCEMYSGVSLSGREGNNYFGGGVTVSGGEAQKIAIARALYKDAPFIILDEPTAALDPVAEAEIYAKFNEIAGDKTAIYISHRLSSCKFCDEIAVFDHGEVIQQGTHERLLADPAGKYYELWNAQAQYYTEEPA